MLGHHWGGGKAALGFGPDWIRTLVSMATDSSHRVIMGKIEHSSAFIFSSPVQSTGRAIVLTLASALTFPLPSGHV